VLNPKLNVCDQVSKAQQDFEQLQNSLLKQVRTQTSRVCFLYDHHRASLSHFCHTNATLQMTLRMRLLLSGNGPLAICLFDSGASTFYRKYLASWLKELFGSDDIKQSCSAYMIVFAPTRNTEQIKNDFPKFCRSADFKRVFQNTGRFVILILACYSCLIPCYV
jgi:hypothetical protein